MGRIDEVLGQGQYQLCTVYFLSSQLPDEENVVFLMEERGKGGEGTHGQADLFLEWRCAHSSLSHQLLVYIWDNKC